jgi:hypothetical protein
MRYPSLLCQGGLTGASRSPPCGQPSSFSASFRKIVDRGPTSAPLRHEAVRPRGRQLCPTPGTPPARSSKKMNRARSACSDPPPTRGQIRPRGPPGQSITGNPLTVPVVVIPPIRGVLSGENCPFRSGSGGQPREHSTCAVLGDDGARLDRHPGRRGGRGGRSGCAGRGAAFSRSTTWPTCLTRSSAPRRESRSLRPMSLQEPVRRLSLDDFAELIGGRPRRGDRRE